MNITVKTDEQAQEIMKNLWDDRLTFTKQIIKATPSEQQAEALIAFDTHDEISISSGHGAGKDMFAVCALLHYMACRPFPKIPCTAPSRHQLHDVLWSEISKWHRQMNPIFRNMFRWSKERFYHVDHPEEWFAVARTATKENPEAMQGFHAKFVMRIIDEASGVPEPIFEVSDGATGTIETKELMIANPTRLEGSFYRSHHQDKDEYWTRTWSCLKSTIAPPKFIRRIAKKYGEDSNIYRVRVLGLFPLREGDSWIPYDWAMAALNRQIDDQKDQPLVFGVDPARFGDDDTCICIRQGDDVWPVISLHGKDTMQVAHYVKYLANKFHPKMIYIDINGLGAGVHDRLYEEDLPVYGVNVSENAAYNPLKYHRLRDELWGNARDWFEMRRGRIRDNEDFDFIGQLTTPKYKFDKKGRIIIETKADMKHRGVDSPNMADAFNLTHTMPMLDLQYKEELEDMEYAGHVAGPAMLDPEVGY